MGAIRTATQTAPLPTVWDGEVEVFTVNHARARKAYAWSTAEGKFTAVLQIPPATDPQNAVRVSIVADAKKGPVRGTLSQ
jgi:hypothetical protein